MKIALRILLGDRPVQMATRINRRAIAARLRRVGCALSKRLLANPQSPTGLPH
jgi:hypothetical protein